MTVLRALLFAVFGGFIGAAPAAPVVAGPDGAFSDATKQIQKSERPTCEESERPASAVAGAPPHAGTGAAALPPAIVARPPIAAVAAAPALRGRTVPPPVEDVRAGLLGLPPPAR